MVDIAPEVDWVPGVSRRWWSAGLLSILLAAGFAGDFLANALRSGPGTSPSFIATLVPLTVAAVIGLPTMFLYLRIVPTVARLGVTREGLFVDFSSPRALTPGFREGYRWEVLHRTGRRLMLPRTRIGAPTSLRLSAFQLERVGPRVSGS